MKRQCGRRVASESTQTHTHTHAKTPSLCCKYNMMVMYQYSTWCKVTCVHVHEWVTCPCCALQVLPVCLPPAGLHSVCPLLCADDLLFSLPTASAHSPQISRSVRTFRTLFDPLFLLLWCRIRQQRHFFIVGRHLFIASQSFVSNHILIQILRDFIRLD